MDKFTVYIGYKTLRKLQETKIIHEKGDIELFRKSASSYWDSDVEFMIDIQSLIFINERLDGGFTSEVLAKLNALINDGHKTAIFSRTVESGLAPGNFIVYINEDTDELST